MTRSAALVLALVPGAAAWALLGTLRFEGLLALGVVALLGGIWTLAQPLPRGLRAAVAAFACLSLLGTTGARMVALAGSFRPFSTYVGLNQRDELFLPVASKGEYALDGWDRDAPRVILNLDRRDQLVWKQKRVSLAEADGVLGSLQDAKVLIRSDRDIPFQHVGWLAALAAARGHREVRLAVERFGRLPGDDTLLGAELSSEHWPQLELPFPIGPAEGPRVRVVAAKWQEGLWPPAPPWGRVDDVPRRMERVATGVRYELGGRATEDLRDLASWLRETRPVAIEADPPAPLKFVVAVQNEVRKAGHPPAALVLPPPPGDDVLRKEHLPYPAAD